MKLQLCKASKSWKQFVVPSIQPKNEPYVIILCTKNYPNVRFLGKLRTPQFASEIVWPLPAQICMLRIAPLKIAHHKTCIQRLWWRQKNKKNAKIESVELPPSINQYDFFFLFATQNIKRNAKYKSLAWQIDLTRNI